MVASSYGHTATVQYLVGRGANVEAADTVWWTNLVILLLYFPDLE